MDNQTPMKDYKDLIVWKKSMRLTKEVYTLTSRLPKAETFGLTSQLQRAAASVPANIAEGYGRCSKLDYLHFLRISRGSLYELETELWICVSLGYVSKKEATGCFSLQSEVSRMLYGLIQQVSASQKHSSANTLQ